MQSQLVCQDLMKEYGKSLSLEVRKTHSTVR